MKKNKVKVIYGKVKGQMAKILSYSISSVKSVLKYKIWTFYRLKHLRLSDMAQTKQNKVKVIYGKVKGQRAKIPRWGTSSC